MSEYILPFDQINAENLPQVGGKGANLGELTQAGFNVPPGFCVTTLAYGRFITQTPINIYTQLDQLAIDNLPQLREVGQHVRETLSQLTLPDNLIHAIVEQWRETGNENAYAVRSSATAEDLPTASFAGQQDTYLNIIGETPLLESIKACFISLFTDRAILYRIQNNFDHRQVALSVVIQQMVFPEVSGILFTADPISGNRHIASIDASFGLGEALVSGLVSADLFQVDKRTNQIIKRQIAQKKLAIQPVKGGGTEQIVLTDSDRERPALTTPQAVELTKIGSQIESHYGLPQDIEWALVNDTVFITQSRPITSLYPLPDPRPTDEALHVYVSMSHFQVMTDAMPPLAISLWRSFLPLARQKLASPYMHGSGGRLYVDITPALRHPITRRLFVRAFDFADQLTAAGLQNILTHPNLLTTGERFSLFPTVRKLLPFVPKVMNALWFDQAMDATKTAVSVMDQHVNSIESRLHGAPTLKDKLDIAIESGMTFFQPASTWLPKFVAGNIAYRLARLLMSGDEYAADFEALERGLQGNVVTDMNLMAGDLADIARSNVELADHLSNTAVDAQTRLATVVEINGGIAFLEQWHHFLKRYGSRGPSEIDISRPRWHEDSSSLLQMVIGMMQSGSTGGHCKHYQRLIDANETAVNNLKKSSNKGLFGWLRGRLIRRFLKVHANGFPLREHHKFLMVRLLWLTKQVLLEIGAHFSAENRVTTVDDIWYLTLPEILDALENPSQSFDTLIQYRRTEFEHHKKLTPPRVITSEGEIPPMKLNVEAPSGALVGSPVSAGVIEGVAKVVLDPSNEMLVHGEILVAPFTDPGWTPLFVNAAALVTEVGGLMTHGSVVAREYGIPAVVGVPNATVTIQSGQRLRVHGDGGYVEILSEEGNFLEESIT